MDSQVHQNADGFEAALTTESPWTEGSDQHAFTTSFEDVAFTQDGQYAADEGEHVAFTEQWPFAEGDAQANSPGASFSELNGSEFDEPEFTTTAVTVDSESLANVDAPTYASETPETHSYEQAIYEEATYEETYSEPALYEGVTEVFAHAVPASDSDHLAKLEGEHLAYAEPVALEQAQFVEQPQSVEQGFVEVPAYSEEYEGEYREEYAGDFAEGYDEIQSNLVPFATYDDETTLGKVDAAELGDWAQTDDFSSNEFASNVVAADDFVTDDFVTEEFAPLPKTTDLNPERASADAALAALTAAVAGGPIATSAKDQKKSAKDEAKAAKAAEKAAKTAAKSEGKTAKVKKVGALDVDGNAVVKNDKAAAKAEAKLSKKASKESNGDAGSTVEGTAKPKARLAVIGAALVALLGGGAYVATSGGGQAAVPVVTTPVTAPAVPAASGALATEAAKPTELALSDPAATDDELGFEEPIEAIEIEEPVAALPLDEPAASATTAPAATAPAATAPAATAPAATAPAATAPAATAPAATAPAATAPAAVPAAVPAGQLSRGACVQVDGVRDVRTRRIPDAKITPTDCAVAHNAEIVEKTSSACEPLVVSYTGYDKSGAQALAGSGADFSVVQNAADGSIFCVAGFEGMPQYTGQLAGAMIPS